MSCEVFIRSFGSISEKTMVELQKSIIPSSYWVYLQDYQVDLYLRQHWFDPRLNHTEIKQVGSGFSFLDKVYGLSFDAVGCYLLIFHSRFSTLTIQNWSKPFGNLRLVFYWLFNFMNTNKKQFLAAKGAALGSIKCGVVVFSPKLNFTFNLLDFNF